MSTTVPPGNTPENHHDSNPTPEPSEWTRGYLAGFYDQQTGNDPQVDDPGEPGSDDELLAAVDPATAALARRISARLAKVTQLEATVEDFQRELDAKDEQWEAGWVSGAARTANAIALDRISTLEKRVDDLNVVAEALGRARPAEPQPPGVAQAHARVRARGVGPTLADRLHAVEERLDQLATAESIVSRATGQEPEPEYDDRYLAGYADGLAGRALGEPNPDPLELGKTPATRAFQLGREIERRQWLLTAADGEASEVGASDDAPTHRDVPDGTPGDGGGESCGRPATRVVEAYSPAGGRAHGSLDQARYVCAAHLATVEDAIHAAGMTPHRTGDQVPAAERRCGDVYDYRAGQLRRAAGDSSASGADSGGRAADGGDAS